MHRTTVLRALSITLLLSCASHTHAMKKGKTIRETFQGNKSVVQAAGPTNSGHLNQPAPRTPSPEATAAEEAPLAAVLPETAVVEHASARTAVVAELEAKAASNTTAAQEIVNAPRQGMKTLLGKELVALYNTDEKPLVQKGWIRCTDATLPYKDEGRLLEGLEKNDANYLKDVQAQQDLNRTLNHICAGVIQKLKEQSSLDTESNIRSFTIDQIETILETQTPRMVVLSKILGLCAARIAAKQEPILHPQENAKELVQKCFTGISQLQLERKHIRSQQENERIRQIKAAQRLAYSMRLTTDKGSISDDEYTDAVIFEKTISSSF